jgi:phosphoribosylaminoimidazole-succinocarboxamide synthase
MQAARTVTETNIAGLELAHRGKVRDVYKVNGKYLLLVATDRISAFDCVMPTPIPQKGRVLTALSEFWFDRFQHHTAHHLITADFDKFPEHIRSSAPELCGRSMLVKKTEVFPVECVVRGYLAGSGWKDYQATGAICGHELPAGLKESDRLPEPIFTPATKEQSGHDINISEIEMVRIVGAEAAAALYNLALKLYHEACAYALTKGIIIADTKFEFGRDENGNILLIDEVLTPDSSRFWSVDTYQPGRAQASFDKQFVRDYLETLDWNKQPPAPALPEHIVSATTDRYLSAYKLLTGRDLSVAQL